MERIEEVIACSSGCGNKTWLNEKGEPAQAGWEYLSISARWRCGTCWRELRAASAFPGAPAGEFIDAIPPDSRGALPKETATTISPPVLKG
jgi:hypothetical protein